MTARTIAALLALALSSAAATADEVSVADWLYEVKGGVLYHDADDMWSGFSREEGVDVNLEVVFAPTLEVLWGGVRPALGGSLNTSGDTSKVYLDARYEYAFEFGTYFNFGVGGAWHNGETELVDNDRKALGSHFLFHIPVEIGHRFDGHHGISVYFDHVSNAYLADENEGMDTIGVRYGYRF